MPDAEHLGPVDVGFAGEEPFGEEGKVEYLGGNEDVTARCSGPSHHELAASPRHAFAGIGHR